MLILMKSFLYRNMKTIMVDFTWHWCMARWNHYACPNGWIGPSPTWLLLLTTKHAKKIQSSNSVYWGVCIMYYEVYFITFNNIDKKYHRYRWLVIVHQLNGRMETTGSLESNIIIKSEHLNKDLIICQIGSNDYNWWLCFVTATHSLIENWVSASTLKNFIMCMYVLVRLRAWIWLCFLYVWVYLCVCKCLCLYSCKT